MVVTGHTSADLPDPVGPATDATAGRASRPVSIRDVAAAAGVSYQTVSRVINDHPSVRQSTRELVLATIADLGFRPNRAARALAGGPVQSVTVLTADTTRYGYRAGLQGIEEAARAAGFAVGIRVLDSPDPADVGDAVARAVEPGGALIVIAYNKAGVEALAAVPPAVPAAAMVGIPEGDDGAGRPWVWLDDRNAAKDATRYLLSLGHRTVHYLAIPSPARTDQRMAGWRAALAEAGAPVPEPALCGWTPRSGYEVGRTLAAAAEVTAVLCGNDDLAVGVMRAMHEAGRAVPGDVSIVGFDDTPEAEFMIPALTTVRQDFTGLGRACFATLLRLLDPDAPAPEPWPEPALIIRESAGPA
jgi:DNA-binding LacI/PurR family transcriptional regulator